MKMDGERKLAAAFGYLNLDILYSGMPRVPAEGEEIYASDFSVQIGGGPAATLAVLKRLGTPVKLLTMVGRGNFFSDFMRGQLEETGIGYEDIYEGEGVPFCVSAAMITEKDRTFASYLKVPEPGRGTYARIARILAESDFVLMGGGDLELYREVKRLNPKVTLLWDTGWHDDLSLERYRGYLELADYYTPNLPEALKITGADTPEEALGILGHYLKCPVVKLGSSGCLYGKEGRIWKVPILEGIRAVDATGAGDAFLGGFLYGVSKGREIGDCVRFGNVTGGICVSQVGCLRGTVNEREMLELAEGIVPEEL